MSKETLAEMTAEYNKLTGKSIKSFTDRKTGIRRLKNARVLEASDKKLKKATSGAKKTRVLEASNKKLKKATTAGMKKPRIPVQVGSRKFRSVHNAYMQLDIPLGSVNRTRKDLHETGHAVIGKHKFKVIK